MQSEFYAGKRALVTGHTGFKGSWLVKWLSMQGAEVLGISLLPEAESGYAALCFDGKVTDRFLDIRDGKALREAVEAFQPEMAFHLAAQAIVGRAQEDPLTTFSTNVMGTANLLEALRGVPGFRAVLAVTSDKVYENLETGQAYREEDRIFSTEPYAASKACQEIVCAAYREAFLKKQGVGVATARAANVYGGGDLHYDRLIPYLCRAQARGEQAEIRSPLAVRPWQYILDLLYGYLLLMEALYEKPEAFSEGFNFGPPASELYTVEQIVNILTDRPAEVVESGLLEATLLLLDSEKSRRRLLWEPIYPVARGLSKTAAFYKRHLAGEPLSALMEEEIRAYEQDREDVEHGKQ